MKLSKPLYIRGESSDFHSEVLLSLDEMYHAEKLYEEVLEASIDNIYKEADSISIYHKSLLEHLRDMVNASDPFMFLKLHEPKYLDSLFMYLNDKELKMLAEAEHIGLSQVFSTSINKYRDDNLRYQDFLEPQQAREMFSENFDSLMRERSSDKSSLTYLINRFHTINGRTIGFKEDDGTKLNLNAELSVNSLVKESLLNAKLFDSVYRVDSVNFLNYYFSPKHAIIKECLITDAGKDMHKSEVVHLIEGEAGAINQYQKLLEEFSNRLAKEGIITILIEAKTDLIKILTEIITSLLIDEELVSIVSSKEFTRGLLTTPRESGMAYDKFIKTSKNSNFRFFNKMGTYKYYRTITATNGSINRVFALEDWLYEENILELYRGSYLVSGKLAYTDAKLRLKNIPLDDKDYLAVVHGKLSDVKEVEEDVVIRARSKNFESLFNRDLEAKVLINYKGFNPALPTEIVIVKNIKKLSK